MAKCVTSAGFRVVRDRTGSPTPLNARSAAWRYSWRIRMDLLEVGTSTQTSTEPPHGDRELVVS